MASAACTNWYTRPYIGGWNDGPSSDYFYSDFTSSDSDGYCYTSGSSTTYAFCFYFKTPAISNFYQSTKLTVTLPIIRTSSKFATSGTLYFKLLTSNPTPSGTSGGLSDNMKPGSKVTADASCTWSSTDQDPHKVTFEIKSTTLKANTGYYVTVGGSKLIGIGWGGATKAADDCTPGNGWWSATLDYETFTDGTAPTISRNDTKNYKFTISGTLGRGTNNPLKSATLYVVVNNAANRDRQPDSSKDYTKSYGLGTTAGDSYSKTIDVPSNAVQIIAVTYCTYTYGSTTAAKTTSTGHKPWDITYECPSDPGIPALESSSYRNNRLTVRQNWTYSWTDAEAGSVNAPVTGYRLRLYKKTGDTEVIVPIEDANGKTKLNGNSTTDYILDTGSTTTSFTFDPTYYGFKAGDEVRLGIYAYADTAAGRKWNGNGTANAQRSSEYTPVENAGVVKVKVDNSWVEGQVYVKVGNEWKEAETVNIKTSSGWIESQ